MALDLRGPVIRGGVASGSENAAGLVNLTNSFASARSGAPMFDEISNASMSARADLTAEKFMQEGAAHETGLNALGGLKRMQMKTDAIDEANNKIDGANKTGGFLAGIGQIGGALLMGGPTAPIGAALGGIKMATSLFG